MISLASLRAGFSPIGRHVPCFLVGRFGITFEAVASGADHRSTPLRTRKKKLDAISDPRIEHARTPRNGKQAAQFDFRRGITLFVFRVERSVWISDLDAWVRYRFKPAQIDCYTSLVSARGVTEVRPESFDHSTKGVACTARARVNVGIGLSHFVRGDGRQ